MSKPEELMPPVHPGEILREDFMKPLGLSSVPTLCEQNQLVIGNLLNFIARRLGK